MTSGTTKERWCNWKGGTTDWAGPLPSLEMVSSGMVFASPDQLRFRDPKAFFPGNVHNNISLWQQIMPGGRPKSDEILKYLELGVDVTDFFTPFKGIFQGKFYDHPTPPQAWFPNSKSCIPFDNFVTETILSRVSTGSLLVWGKVGDIEPPTIVMPITVEPGKPRMCHDESQPVTIKVGTTTSFYPGIVLPFLVWNGKVGFFVFRTLPFGWKASAYLYHSNGLAATSFIRSLGVPCSQYIDDRHFGQLRVVNPTGTHGWSDFENAQAAIFIGCSLLIDLGYFIAIEKSSLAPSQSTKFLGYIVDTTKLAFLLPLDKKAKFAALREDILGKKSVALKPLQKFAGKINSFSLVIPAARLYVRKVYDAISKATVSPKAIKITDALRDEISHWRFLDSWEGFFPWPREEHCRLELPIFSDASNTGWGGVVHTPQEALKVSGYWNPDERKLPIVVKETLALRNTLKSTCSRLKGARIDCFIDNKTLLHCWENHGSRNVEVTDVLKQIYDISLTHHLSLNLQYIPSADNPADTPSRRLSDLDCTLSPLAWKQVQQAYGPHSIDLMAIPANVQSDPSGRPLRFFSPFPVDQAC
ncbi:hypothetical protein QZH41_010670, partial [Actinostola sp. cb2023]